MMALDVDYLYQFSLKLIRKNQAGGLTSTEFQYHWNDAQCSYQDDILGRFQLRNNGKTGLNTGIIEDETIIQKLAAFTHPATISIISGNVLKPSDFVYRLAFRINGVDCFKINQNQIASVNASVIDPPSVNANTFYFVEYEGYYYILPHTLPSGGITTADLDYISTPPNVQWCYTFDTAGRQVYNASGITGVNVIYGGVGYTTPTITFSAPAAGGVQATGTLTVVGGVITAVVMTNVGFGYAGLNPTFTITGGNTTPADLSNPLVSVQPLWGSNSCREITKRMLTNLGVSFKDSDFENFGKSVQITGE